MVYFQKRKRADKEKKNKYSYKNQKRYILKEPVDFGLTLIAFKFYEFSASLILKLF